MSTKEGSHHFDPTLMLESILGDLERNLDRLVQLMHKRLDRIENESLKKRGSTQSSGAKVSNHEFRTLSGVYERTCDSYMANQKRTCRASKRSSTSTKLVCSFERSHDHNRDMELKNSRSRSTYSELKEERLLKREKEQITSIFSKTKHASTSTIDDI